MCHKRRDKYFPKKISTFEIYQRNPRIEKMEKSGHRTWREKSECN